SSSNFKVLIVGGGVGGLTAALSLAKAGIDYILLESRPDFAPTLGASIGILASGQRVLDQLGLVESIEKVTEPVDQGIIHRNDGSVHLKLDIFEINAIFGYNFTFTTRQLLLQLMYGAVPEKSKLLSNKKVKVIQETKDGVIIETTDGAVYQGDMVIGADGVHSIVRDHIFNAIGEEKALKEKKRMTATYSCIYGISDPVPGVKPGENHIVFGNRSSFFVVAGKGGTVYWFLYEKMERTYQYNEIPRFSAQDTDAAARKYMDSRVTGNVTFGDIYTRCQSAIKVPLEEALYKHWHHGRCVLVGDAVHKMTPNAGQGGNSAIESVAVLTNELKRMLDAQQLSTRHPTEQQLAAIFERYQKKREKRVKSILKFANNMTRQHALEGPVDKFVALYLIKIVS
ncbi:FAD binding domain-containing protein, partial [Gongronella butleri]